MSSVSGVQHADPDVGTAPPQITVQLNAPLSMLSIVARDPICSRLVGLIHVALVR